ncbi:MAG: hypothetical protein BJ554DRAFT_3821 [Olpidium bornovanus]|uniref:Uncharacterized protein n=1 Tax=Olpidium bornovanus TaxID=278681 RepID=A0A8H7ZNM0_9FUNG|nr:MAG: hypothetical protein BJ554DRAFT_3821 [Olpidium bornovanus]
MWHTAKKPLTGAAAEQQLPGGGRCRPDGPASHSQRPLLDDALMSQLLLKGMKIRKGVAGGYQTTPKQPYVPVAFRNPRKRSACDMVDVDDGDEDEQLADARCPDRTSQAPVILAHNRQPGTRPQASLAPVRHQAAPATVAHAPSLSNYTFAKGNLAQPTIASWLRPRSGPTMPPSGS